MRVDTLLVEGSLDAEVLGALFAGRPLVEATKTSKDALAPRVRTERQKGKRHTYFLRDRDFDWLPPTQCRQPVPIESNGEVLGWYWCRHELENYMLEPDVVTACLGESSAGYRKALHEAAKRLRYYEAARWAIGQARSRLPKGYMLTTRPDSISHKEFSLPPDISEAKMHDWAVSSTADYAAQVSEVLGKGVMDAHYSEFVYRLGIEGTASTNAILLWHSGKDLMCGLADWLKGIGMGSPGAFRTALRDGIRSDVERLLDIIPEWKGLVALVSDVRAP